MSLYPSNRNVHLGPGKQRGNLGLVWRNRKQISQIINDYINLTFFLLIVLCSYLYLPLTHSLPPPSSVNPLYHSLWSRMTNKENEREPWKRLRIITEAVVPISLHQQSWWIYFDSRGRIIKKEWTVKRYISSWKSCFRAPKKSTFQSEKQTFRL